MSAAAVLTQWGGWNSPVIQQETFIFGRSITPGSRTRLSPSVSLCWLTSSRRTVEKLLEKPAAQLDVKKCIDILSRLPPELQAMILSYLNASDLCRCQQVSSCWYHMITQDPNLMKKCKTHLRKMKAKYFNSKENNVHLDATVIPHSTAVNNNNSTNRSILNSLHNSTLPLYYSAPSIPTQSPPNIELLNFDRLKLRDDTTTSESLHDNVRRCLFPDNENIRNGVIEDNSFSICCRENKKRIKRL